MASIGPLERFQYKFNENYSKMITSVCKSANSLISDRHLFERTGSVPSDGHVRQFLVASRDQAPRDQIYVESHIYGNSHIYDNCHTYDDCHNPIHERAM